MAVFKIAVNAPLNCQGEGFLSFYALGRRQLGKQPWLELPGAS
jgi:hypothetical protein